SHPRVAWCRRTFKFQELSKAIPAFAEVFAHLPEAKKSSSQAQTPFGVAGFYEPVESRAKIVVFSFKAIQPSGLARARILGSPFLRQDETVSGMGTPRQ